MLLFIISKQSENMIKYNNFIIIYKRDLMSATETTKQFNLMGLMDPQEAARLIVEKSNIKSRSSNAEVTTTNLIGSLQDPPVVEEYPINLPSGDFRNTVKTDIINKIKLGTQASVSLKLRNTDSSYELLVGYRSVENQDPITDQTIYRIASMSKKITAVTVMQYVEKNRVSLNDDLSMYFPSFADTRVLQKVVPEVSHPLSGLTSMAGSDIISVSLPSLADPQLNDLLNKQIGIQISAPVVGVSVDGIFVVTGIDLPSKTIVVKLNAISTVSGTFVVAGTINVLPNLPTGWAPYDYVTVPSVVSPFIRVREYYSTVAADAPVKLYHLLNHTIGYAYATPGYRPNLIPLQTSIMQKLDPELVRFILNPTLDIDVVQWVTRLSAIPMLFQPGTQNQYGPAMGIAGGVLVKYERDRKPSKNANITLFEIQKESLFDPLGITSAGYFIHDNDPQRAAKIASLAHIYTNVDTALTQTPTVTNPYVSQVIALQDLILAGLNGKLIDGANPSQEGAPNPLHPIYGSQTPRKLELGDAGLYMTNDDFYKIVDALRNFGTHDNKRILKEKTVEEMFKNQIGSLSVTEPPASGDQKWGYGFCVGDESSSGSQLNLVTAWWCGAFGGYWLADTDPSDTALAINSNGLPGSLLSVVNYIVSNTHVQ